ncbi:MAG TPA: D-Ala-D-Ala carboxypeptidase family metallohydrolase [Polyangiaceae bacterium]|jgi:hypothetical protein
MRLARVLPLWFGASVALSGLLAVAHVTASSQARRIKRLPLELSAFGPTRPLNDTAWLVDGFDRKRKFALSAGPLLGLLERYVEPERDRAPEWRRYWRGRYGRASWQLGPQLSWLGEEPAREPSTLAWADEALELRAPRSDEPLDFTVADVLPDWSLDVSAPMPELLGIAVKRSCPVWKRPKAVTLIRYDGGEWARLPLVDCDGAIAPDALDRLSSLARPPDAPRPDFPLPIEPENDAAGGEWLPKMKLVHPRLIWAVEKIAEAFPGRSISIMSGYRRDAHDNFHQRGRALDLAVAGIDDADLFAFCRTLADVGCGYYPNNKFVHVDVRPFGTHRVAWVDISGPGEPAQYVRNYPGVLGDGANSE